MTVDDKLTFTNFLIFKQNKVMDLAQFSVFLLIAFQSKIFKAILKIVAEQSSLSRSTANHMTSHHFKTYDVIFMLLMWIRSENIFFCWKFVERVDSLFEHIDKQPISNFLGAQWHNIQIRNMISQNSKNRSRCSSSSSGSMKLVHQHEIQKYELKMAHDRDLFDLLLDQNQDSSNEHRSILRTISQMNLSPRQQPQQGCKCSKIDCLKMYCECFSKGRLCNEKCECYTCCNKEDCRLQIYKAQQLANFRHPGTFKGVPAWVPQRRCTCKKSGCRKNYCECYRAGIKCGQECECVMCQNGKPHSHDDFIDSRMQIEVNA